MRPKTFSIRLTATLAIFAMSLLATSTCAAAEKLQTFRDSGEYRDTAFGGSAVDASGKLYGTTLEGGARGTGTVFELTPSLGGWTETVLYNFTEKYPNPYYPEAGLLIDAAGNLYGTTEAGGTSNAGTVFELKLKVGGGWTETVLHNFAGGDGSNPCAGLIFDAAGNLYGTTQGGGTHGSGTVFELIPAAGGSWTEKVLYSFPSGRGSNPYAGLILDAAGHLYGTTQDGGTHGYGAVFELAPRADGGWTEKTLHNFGQEDGAYPYSGLILDATGNLYGTTVEGGKNNLGTVFELTPTRSGGWKETVLHTFAGGDGAYPLGGLIFDAADNLYGTTSGGGSGSCGQYQGACGTVFELTPTTGGGWTEQVLHNFAVGDGYFPCAGLVFDDDGNLYGTTSGGGNGKDCGKGGCGTVFELMPTAGGGWMEQVLYNFHSARTDGYDPEAGLTFVDPRKSVAKKLSIKHRP